MFFFWSVRMWSSGSWNFTWFEFYSTLIAFFPFFTWIGCVLFHQTTTTKISKVFFGEISGFSCTNFHKIHLIIQLWANLIQIFTKFNRNFHLKKLNFSLVFYSLKVYKNLRSWQNEFHLQTDEKNPLFEADFQRFLSVNTRSAFSESRWKFFWVFWMNQIFFRMMLEMRARALWRLGIFEFIGNRGKFEEISHQISSL